jgi:hypothetical protein
LVHVLKGQRQAVATLIRISFAQKTEPNARRSGRVMAEQLREPLPNPIRWTS